MTDTAQTWARGVVVGDHPTSPAKVRKIVAANGSTRPIQVWQDSGGTVHLVSGRDQLEAILALGQPMVDCIFVKEPGR